MKVPERPLCWGRRWGKCPPDGAVPLHWGGKAAALPPPGLLPRLPRIAAPRTGVSLSNHTKDSPRQKNFLWIFALCLKLMDSWNKGEKIKAKIRGHPNKSDQARLNWTGLVHLCFLRDFLNRGKIWWERRGCASTILCLQRQKVYLAISNAKVLRVLVARHDPDCRQCRGSYLPWS